MALGCSHGRGRDRIGRRDRQARPRPAGTPPTRPGTRAARRAARGGGGGSGARGARRTLRRESRHKCRGSARYRGRQRISAPQQVRRLRHRRRVGDARRRRDRHPRRDKVDRRQFLFEDPLDLDECLLPLFEIQSPTPASASARRLSAPTESLATAAMDSRSDRVPSSARSLDSAPDPWSWPASRSRSHRSRRPSIADDARLDRAGRCRRRCPADEAAPG